MTPDAPIPRPTTRREFLAEASLIAAGVALCPGPSPAVAGTETRQATGIRAGEVTDSDAVVWVRLTKQAGRNETGVVARKGEAITVSVEELEGACPGAAGRVRVVYGEREDLSDGKATEWEPVSAEGDFISQFHLTGLKPGTTYHYRGETAGPDGSPPHAPLSGRFGTAPSSDSSVPVRFCVMTCQGYPDRGHPDGHPIYPAMGALEPAFACLTGDLVYYDNDAPKAETADLARYHWQRMFSLPRLVEFLRTVPTYWLKDDHDTLNDDSWPGRRMGTFTFAEGQRIFRQQAPMHDRPAYRTFRWGRDLQIWLSEGRDHRSPNNTPDGPDKTIWGNDQKEWFQRTVKESTAKWKVLISPTPLVGPDRPRKNDNHSNAGFRYEGDELRGWLREHVPDSMFVVCGDRHWQYHSVHPTTGLHEFSVGPASNEHAGGTPGEDPNYHRFHRVRGGFLSVSVEPAGSISFRHHDVNGEVVYEYRQESA